MATAINASNFKKKIKKREVPQKGPQVIMPYGDALLIEIDGREYPIVREVAVYVMNLVQESYSISTRVPGYVHLNEGVQYPKVRSQDG